MAAKFRLVYSATSRKQIKKLHPHLKPIFKVKIESISDDPYIGKLLEKELSRYISFRAKRFRIIYRIAEDSGTVEIHYIGHRRDIYELFGEQLRALKQQSKSTTHPS